MIKLLEHLGGAVSTRIEIVKGIYKLFKMEAVLAGLTIGPLLITLCMVLTLLMSFWLTVLCLAGYSFMFWTGHLLISLVLVFITNGIFLIIALTCMKIYLKKISFEKTRACLATNKSGDKHELREKSTKIDCHNGHEGAN